MKYNCEQDVIDALTSGTVKRRTLSALIAYHKKKGDKKKADMIKEGMKNAPKDKGIGDYNNYLRTTPEFNTADDVYKLLVDGVWTCKSVREKLAYYKKVKNKGLYCALHDGLKMFDPSAKFYKCFEE